MEIEQDYFWVLVVDGPRRLCKCLSAIIAADHTTPQLNYHNRRNHHYYPTSVTFFTISNFKTIRFTKLKSDFVWSPPPIAFCLACKPCTPSVRSLPIKISNSLAHSQQLKIMPQSWLEMTGVWYIEMILVLHAGVMLMLQIRRNHPRDSAFQKYRWRPQSLMAPWIIDGEPDLGNFSLILIEHILTSRCLSSPPFWTFRRIELLSQFRCVKIGHKSFRMRKCNNYLGFIYPNNTSPLKRHLKIYWHGIYMVFHSI